MPRLLKMRAATGLALTVTTLLLTVGLRISAQSVPERFWLAGRFDDDHVIVDFDAVQFKGVFPGHEHTLREPRAEGFFQPSEVTAGFLAPFQARGGAEHFRIGETYDWLLGHGQVATATLSMLIGFESDEGVGNDSYIGAIADVQASVLDSAPSKHFVVRRHSVTKDASATSSKTLAGLQAGAVSSAVTSSAGALLKGRLLLSLSKELRDTFASQSLSSVRARGSATARGEQRYLISGRMGAPSSCRIVDGWVAPDPVRVLAATVMDGWCYPDSGSFLENVFDLGGGRTGLIVFESGEDGHALVLVEYRDGVDLAHMRRWHELSVGE